MIGANAQLNMDGLKPAFARRAIPGPASCLFENSVWRCRMKKIALAGMAVLVLAAAVEFAHWFRPREVNFHCAVRTRRRTRTLGRRRRAHDRGARGEPGRSAGGVERTDGQVPAGTGAEVTAASGWTRAGGAGAVERSRAKAFDRLRTGMSRKDLSTDRRECIVYYWK